MKTTRFWNMLFSAMMLVAMLVAGTTSAMGQVQEVESEDEEWDPEERHDAFVSVWKNDKMGCQDSLGRTVVGCKYDDVYSFYDGLARVNLGGKFGYVDLRGKEVVRCKYDYVSPVFSDDRSLVKLNGKYGYIDKRGKAVIPLKYDWPSIMKYDSINQTDVICLGNQPSTFHEGSAIINDGGTMYLIDVNGNILTPQGYSSFCHFYKDVAMVCHDGKWGSVNRQGKEVEPCVHDYRIHSVNLVGDDIFFLNDRADVYQQKGSRQAYGVIDYCGREVIPCEYDAPLEFPDYPSFEITIAKKNGKDVFLDYTGYELKGIGYWLEGLARAIKGREVIENNDYFIVVSNMDGRQGVINFYGKTVVSPQYKKISLRKDGFYFAYVTDFNDKKGIIDHKGWYIIPCEYDQINYHPYKALFSARKDEKMFYFDYWGNPVDYNSDEPLMSEDKVIVEERQMVMDTDIYHQRGYVSEGMQSVRKGTKWGFVDSHDKEVVPLIYDEVYGFNGDLARVKKDGVWGFVDRHGHSTFDY